jgi:PAS domain S-box-containing protein
MEDITQKKQAEQELRQRNQELSTLYTIALAMTRDPSVNSILHNTLFELTRLLQVEFGCFYLKQEQSWPLASYRGFSASDIEAIKELDLTRRPWQVSARVVRERLDETLDLLTAWEKTQGIQALVYVPLRAKDEFLGVLMLASRDYDRFAPSEFSLITTVASQVATAIENARLFEKLQHSEQKYRLIFENAVMGIYQSSPEGKVLTANPATVRMLGYDSLEELLAADIPHDIYISSVDREKHLEELHRTGRLDGAELRLRRKDGREIIVYENARAVTDADEKVLYYEGTMMDITEKKALEQQLLQAQKMESIGTLAGGIAHDFNNLLTAILGYSSLMLSQSRPGDPRSQDLKIIEQSAKRGAELTARLLAFSRQAISQLRPMKVNDIVDETLPLLRRSLDASIDIEVVKTNDLWMVEADAAQLQQVLMNLCINARDAMPEGGLLRIETANVVLDENHCRRHPEARPGDFVVLRVTDQGVGIASEHLPRIFEPFFTTKEMDKGTGLGLAVVYGIVKGHQGFIEVESQPDAGAQFTIYLPATQKPSISPTPIAPKKSQGQELILVVDDEELVTQLAKLILERDGYSVLTADSGVEALKIYRERGHEIELIVLDLTMPKMNGRECYRQLVKLNPTVKVLLSSGYSANGAVKELLEEGAIGFIQKPYRAEELSRAVREMLDR